MKNFLIKMLSTNNNVSSKRVITLLAFMLMGIGFISNLFFDLTIEEFIYESMKWIVIGGLGFTASESFAGKTPPKNESENTDDSEDLYGPDK